MSRPIAEILTHEATRRHGYPLDGKLFDLHHELARLDDLAVSDVRNPKKPATVLRCAGLRQQ